MSVFAVLLVCAANQCRSPAAQVALSAFLAGLPGVETASAGTAVAIAPDAPGLPAGLPIHPLTAQALAEAGFAVPAHESAPLSPQLVGAADLILTAERGQRAVVVDLDGAAARRTFTLLEFARVTAILSAQDRDGARDADGAWSPSALVALVAARRVLAPATAADDIPDPVSLGLPAHRQLVVMLTRVMRDLAMELAAD